MCLGEQPEKWAKFTVWDKVPEGITLIFEDTEFLSNKMYDKMRVACVQA